MDDSIILEEKIIFKGIKRPPPTILTSPTTSTPEDSNIPAQPPQLPILLPSPTAPPSVQSLGVQVDVNSNGSMKGEEDVGFTKVAVETLSRDELLAYKEYLETEKTWIETAIESRKELIRKMPKILR